MAQVRLEFVKNVRSKGRDYLYFDTGERANGKPVYIRLPDGNDPDFGTRYGTLKAIRTKRDNRVKLVTFKELASQYQLSQKFLKRSAGTQRTYMFYIVRAIDMFGDWPAADIDRADIRTLLADLGTGAQKMCLLVAKNIFRYGINQDLVSENPTDGIEIEHEAVAHEPWPEDLIKAALSDDEMRLPVALLYYTGQRIGDVVRMRWTDIKDGILYVTQQKTGTELEIPVHSRLAEILAEQQRGITTILCRRDGTAISTDALRPRITTWTKDRGKKYVPHGLRHNAVNALLEAECSVGQVSSITGQSLQMVEHYARKRNRAKMAKGAMKKWDNSQ